jgi:hypothetical protein
MKKLFALIVLLFAVNTTRAQIQQLNTVKPLVVGKVGGSGWVPFESSLEYLPDSTGSNTYILTYRDITYKQLVVLKTVTFKATEQELNSFYDLLKVRIDEKKDAETSLKLGDDTVLIVTAKTMGMGSIYLSVTGKGMFALYTKTLNKLFGRDK